MDAARRTLEPLYREHPAVLGVIRATVDFYWRNQLPEESIRTLTEGRGRAHASLKPAFTYEAARKSTSAGAYEQARSFLSELLVADPFDPRHLPAMADSWLRAGDDASLRTFYTAKIQEMTAARVDRGRIAALRRGLIPVLDRLKVHMATCDQYIEILPLFAENEGLAREAAQHAQAHGLRSRLTGYFAKATTDSPRDPRWHIVLARLQTAFEHFPAAITSYNRGIEVRPDRADLLEMRTSLEERLRRFDGAVQGYSKLYDLTYKDPKWMLKIAEMRARRGRKADVMKTLEQALVEGQPPRPANLLEPRAASKVGGS